MAQPLKAWNCLIRIKSANGWRSHLIAKTQFTLGRTQDADVPLLSPSISRVHLIVELRDGEVWVTDKNSANGTSKGQKPLPPGVPTKIEISDVLKLGTETDEFSFLCFPEPLELQGKEFRVDSLKDSMKDVARQFELQSKERVEKELIRARGEAEQILVEAKKNTEIQRTQENFELQGRRQQVENEMARLRQTTQEDLARERLRSKREADNLIADAQRTIQKDFEEASQKIEVQMAEAHAHAFTIVQQAEISGQTSISEANNEALRIRTSATEEARLIHKEAVKKGDEYLKDLGAKYAREIHESKAQMIEAARIEARLESERTIAGLKEARTELAALTSNIEGHRAEDAKAKASLIEKEASLRALEEKSHELTAANEALTERREIREKRILEFEGEKRKQETEMVRVRMKALDEVKKMIRDEEKKYEETRRLRAFDLARALNAKIIPNLNTLLADREVAPGLIKATIEQAAMETVLNTETILPNVKVLDDEPAKNAEKIQRVGLRALAVAIAVLLVCAYVFRDRIEKFVKSSQQNSYSSKMIEERRAASVYTPKQDDEFRDSYTENVLHLRRYFEVKTDSAATDAWILKLNDLKILKPLGLSEEDVIKFVARESNLVQRLGVLRGSIDAVYLNEGFERLRKAEAEDVREMVEILKGESNFRKFQGLEKQFLTEYMAKVP